ncbi:MAG: VOC family protein [Gammaproteobacteria bacterium]|nr:VOC family protein [Pseudomonadales bacterium]MCP5348105.1 VOC family protein [Pseudomonadales bacterium]
MRKLIVVALTLLASVSAQAQLTAARNSEIAYGHHHINTTDVLAQQRFWVEGLGGRLSTFGSGNREVIVFPNVLVLFSERAPEGGSRGTAVNHVGFETTDIHSTVSRLREMGYEMISRQELPSVYEVDAQGIASRPGGNTIAFVLGPDQTKVELIENTEIPQPIQLHHIHWSGMENEAMRDWYVDVFGALPGSRIGQPAADLPGVNLTFAPTRDPVVPTRGHSLDHVGFEVRNLEQFCRQLEARGISLDRGYTEVASLGIAIAFLTDPWGTYIELTEGLVGVE